MRAPDGAWRECLACWETHRTLAARVAALEAEVARLTLARGQTDAALAGAREALRRERLQQRVNDG